MPRTFAWYHRKCNPDRLRHNGSLWQIDALWARPDPRCDAPAHHHSNLPVVSHVAAKSRSPHPKCFCRKAIQCPAAILGQVLSLFAPLIAATTAVPLHDEKTRTLSLLVLGVRGGDSPQRSGARSCTKAKISFKTASFTKAYGLIARVTTDSCHNSSSRCCSGV